ncbi:hypothetical protein BCV69DRAFT_51826 [Microstroma glucosiphilum]|uniref:ATPase AAA-type core domain-containing protein n=1 Tax=Pseudomicrostroma glucosiphilum TaxID=1684307 RepID=A0A316U8M9_9BASI|nr:hypothetical protein BCV69DRAFT_51826 [Pseudomicrostroma glucosiphilum]PWN19335.1 hypothetical protein BCV69DRAFT_51826 [Pseudomicrostroma glucosiphilum]
MDHQDLDLAADSRDVGTAQGASGSSSGTASGSGSGSRSSSPVPVEVPVQTEDGKSQDQTASNDAHGVEAKRKKLFALFQKKNKDDPEASGSVAAGAAAELPAAPTNKRPARSRAAKTRQTTLVDLTIEQDDEEWAPSSIASSSRPKKKSKAAKEVQQPPPPPRQRSPLPPLKLNVSGTGLADGQVAHSFFDRRPAGETSHGGSVAPTTKEKLTRSAVSLGRKKPTMHVPWPSRESVHVLPPDQMSGIGADAAAARGLPFARSDVKGKGKAISNGAKSLIFPSQGLAEEVRRKKRGRKPSLPLRSTNGSTLQHLPDAVPESLRDHSAFSNAVERGKSQSVGDANVIWSDRWRPRSAEEVLGSESSAKYLRDWLSELRLVSDTSLGSSSSNVADKRAYGDDTNTPEPSVKRRKVQTSVDKLPRKGAKKGNGDASFIVHDDEDELYAFFENAGVRTSQQTDADIDDLGCGFDSQTDNQDSQDEADLDFRASDRLTNCILLYGPPGSGKTAAVFACADELNFEVFELFPGVGKRGSKELKEAVGALGRNHMVSGGGSGGGANRGNGPSGGNAFRALMSSTNGKVPSGRETKPNSGRETKPNLRGRMVIPDSSETEDSQPLVQEGEESTPTVSGTRPSSSTRQSLILIEEADVLFEDDRAFWTGVVDLVKQSKRPVILTCNGE